MPRKIGPWTIESNPDLPDELTIPCKALKKNYNTSANPTPIKTIN